MALLQAIIGGSDSHSEIGVLRETFISALVIRDTLTSVAPPATAVMATVYAMATKAFGHSTFQNVAPPPVGTLLSRSVERHSPDADSGHINRLVL